MKLQMLIEQYQDKVQELEQQAEEINHLMLSHPWISAGVIVYLAMGLMIFLYAVLEEFFDFDKTKEKISIWLWIRAFLFFEFCAIPYSMYLVVIWITQDLYRKLRKR